MPPLPLSSLLTSSLLGTTKDRVQKLGRLGVETVGDLLEFFPRAWEDTSEITPIFQLRIGEQQTIRGRLLSMENSRSPRRGMLLTRGLLEDDSGQIEIVWFQQGHLVRQFAIGEEVLVSGVPKEGRAGAIDFTSPKIEKAAAGQHLGRVAAIYPESEPLTTKWLREKIATFLPSVKFFEERLPAAIREGKFPGAERLGEEFFPLMKRGAAIRELHDPSSPEELEKARRTLAFEELFLLQRENLKRRKAWQEGGAAEGKAIPFRPELVKEFLAGFPFEPTDAQRVAIFEILKDLEKEVPMNRLLEGDVGSGKTLVAAAAALATIDAGKQVAILAPTEVLARQTFGKLLKDFGGAVIPTDREESLANAAVSNQFSANNKEEETDGNSSRKEKGSLPFDSLSVAQGRDDAAVSNPSNIQHQTSNIQLSLGKTLLDAAAEIPFFKTLRGEDLPVGATAFSLKKIPADSPARLFFSLLLRRPVKAEELPPRDAGLLLEREFFPLAGDAAVQNARRGEVLRGKLRLFSPVERLGVEVKVPLPAGAELVDTSLGGESAAFLPEKIPGLFPAPRFLPFQSGPRKELRDSELFLSWERLPAGETEVEFFLRARNPGKFSLLPATAVETSFPENFGSSAGGSFEISSSLAR